MDWRRRLAALGGPVSLEQRWFFFQQLREEFSTGIPLMESLDHLGSRATGWRLGAATLALRRSLEKGQDLSAAMDEQAWAFSPLERALVRAGLKSGRLEELLGRLVATEGRRLELWRLVHRIVWRPVVVLFFGVLAFELTVLWTRGGSLEAWSSFLEGGVVPLLEGLAGGWLALWIHRTAMLLPPLRLARDTAVAFLPWWGRVVRESSLASYLEGLGSLLGAGLELRQALEQAAECAENRFCSLRFSSIVPSDEELPRFSFQRWERLGWIPEQVVRALGTAERAGTLERTALLLAEERESRAMHAARWFSEAMLPLLLWPGVIVTVFVWQWKMVLEILSASGDQQVIDVLKEGVARLREALGVGIE